MHTSLPAWTTRMTTRLAKNRRPTLRRRTSTRDLGAGRRHGQRTARPALFLNLPLPVHGPVSWVPGEPGYLSLRQLLRRPIAWPVAGRRIFICENPDIVAIAADRLGGTCAPLVCTDGMPAAAQRILFDQLLAAGAHLHYHGDYDWPGIGIGNYFMRTWDARPWRFGVADYLAAVACTPPRPSDLSGVSVDALWDFGLPRRCGSGHGHCRRSRRRLPARGLGPGRRCLIYSLRTASMSFSSKSNSICRVSAASAGDARFQCSCRGWRRKQERMLASCDQAGLRAAAVSV